MKLLSMVGAAVLAGLPLAASSAEPTSTAIVKPLVEIGHVRATTSFCKAFAGGAGPAAASAVAFESRLFVTGADLTAYDGTNDLAKYQWGKLLDADLRALADDTIDGQAALSALRSEALVGGTSRLDVVAFADALSGAKGRQLELTRKLARQISTLSAMPTANITDAAYYDEQSGNPYNFLPSRRDAYLVDPTGGASAVFQDSYFTLPGDEAVGADLERAVALAKDVEARENCS